VSVIASIQVATEERQGGSDRPTSVILEPPIWGGSGLETIALWLQDVIRQPTPEDRAAV
jgi:hypothetical protein